MEELLATLKNMVIVSGNLTHLTPAQIGDDDLLFGEEFGLDSIDALDLIMLVERDFGVKIESKEQGESAMRTVRTLAEYIIKNRPAESEPRP